MKNKLTEQEAALLKELIAKRKAGKLTDDEKKQLAELDAKTGYTPGKGKGKGGKDKSPFSPGNDFAWWNKIPELTKDVANLKSDYIAGRNIAEDDIPVKLMGVLLVVLESVYGNTTDAVDAVNEWARELFLRMFQKYRIPGHYTASDLGIAILAAIETVKLIARYERIYGVINRYSILNVNMPYAEIQALGLSISEMETLQGRLSDFRSDLNFLINRAQKVVLPKDISLVADSLSLMGYEYFDHENGRAQIIIFDTRTTGIYSDTDLSTGGSIKFTEVGQDKTLKLFDFNAENMCAALEASVNALVESDSVQKIYADLVVWFGEEAMLHFGPIDDKFVTTPVYSESILHKLHNLETTTTKDNKIRSWAINGMTDDDKNKVLMDHYIYQYNDRIITRCAIAPSAGVGTANTYKNGKILTYPDVNHICDAIEKCHMIDTYRCDVTEETVVEGVMWKFDSEEVRDAADNNARVYKSTSFWVARGLELYTVDGLQMHTTNVTEYDSGQTASIAGYLALIDWAPLVYEVSNESPFNIVSVFGDMDNIVPVYPNNLSKIHRTIILSGLKTEVVVQQKSK